MDAIIAAARKSCAPLVLLFVCSLAGPASAEVVGVSTTGKVQLLDFESLTAVQLNTDANKLSSPGGVAFFINDCTARQDLLVADTNAKQLVHYPKGKTTGTKLCGSGPCPAAPAGIATSDAGLVAVADLGKADAPAAVWFLKQKDVCTANGSPFEAPRRATLVNVLNPEMPIGKVLDAAFVRWTAGGFEIGDLLLVFNEPSMIARIPAGDIETFLAPGSDGSLLVEPLVGPEFFGLRTPFSLAFFPRSGTPLASEALAVSVSGGQVLKLGFHEEGDDPALTGSATLVDALLSNNGPLGLTADESEGIFRLTVADRQNGRFIEFEFDDLSSAALGHEIIKKNVNNPQDVDASWGVWSAEECARGDDPTTTGCRIHNAADLLLVPFPANTVFGDDDIIQAKVWLLPDTGVRPLLLEGFDQPFWIPDSVEGFSVPGLGKLFVVLDVQTNIEFQPGFFITLSELVGDTILPGLGTCKDTSARVLHHPYYGNFGSGEFDPPENGELLDQTVVCRNPSQPIFGRTSPIVIGSDKYREAAKQAPGGKLTGNAAKALQAEILERFSNLELVLDHTALDPLEALRSALMAFATDARKEAEKGKYLAASGILADGALLVFDNKAGIAAIPDLPAEAYAVLLMRFLALAHYLSSTGANVDFCPPESILFNELGILESECGIASGP